MRKRAGGAGIKNHVVMYLVNVAPEGAIEPECACGQNAEENENE